MYIYIASLQRHQQTSHKYQTHSMHTYVDMIIVITICVYIYYILLYVCVSLVSFKQFSEKFIRSYGHGDCLIQQSPSYQNSRTYDELSGADMYIYL